MRGSISTFALNALHGSGRHPLIYHFSIDEDARIIAGRKGSPAGESIDNLSTNFKNLSTEKRTMPRVNRTVLRLHAGFFQSGFCPVLLESSDVPLHWSDNRQPIRHNRKVDDGAESSENRPTNDGNHPAPHGGCMTCKKRLDQKAHPLVGLRPWLWH